MLSRTASFGGSKAARDPAAAAARGRRRQIQSNRDPVRRDEAIGLPGRAECDEPTVLRCECPPRRRRNRPLRGDGGRFRVMQPVGELRRRQREATLALHRQSDVSLVDFLAHRRLRPPPAILRMGMLGKTLHARGNGRVLHQPCTKMSSAAGSRLSSRFVRPILCKTTSADGNL